MGSPSSTITLDDVTAKFDLVRSHQGILSDAETVETLLGLVSKTGDRRRARIADSMETPTGDVIYHFQFGDGELHEGIAADVHIGTEKLARTVAALMAQIRCAFPQPKKTLDVFIADRYLARLDERERQLTYTHLREPDPLLTPDWCHPSPYCKGDTPWAAFFGHRLDHIERDGVMRLWLPGHNREFGRSFLRAAGSPDKVRTIGAAIESVPEVMDKVGLAPLTRFNGRPADAPFLSQIPGTNATFEMETELAYRTHQRARLGETSIEAVWKRFPQAVGLVLEVAEKFPCGLSDSRGDSWKKWTSAVASNHAQISEYYDALVERFERVAPDLPDDDPFVAMTRRRSAVERWGKYLDHFQIAESTSLYESSMRTFAGYAYRTRELAPMAEALHKFREGVARRDPLLCMDTHMAVENFFHHATFGLFDRVHPAEVLRVYLTGVLLAGEIVLDNRLPDPSWVRALDMSRTTGSLSA